MSRKRIAQLLVVLLAGLIAATALPSAAGAHTAGSYFVRGHWPANQSIGYGVNTGFPGGEYRSRLLDGKNQWNNAANTGEPNIYWSLADDISYGTAGSPCGVPGYNTAAIFWNDLDYLSSGTLGATRLCGSTSVIFNFTIEFDSDRSWYTGTGDSPDNRPDFWSIASHEFGHAVGFWNHLPAGECPNNSTKFTMCPTYDMGTERQRTLTAHDIHTFDAAY